MDLDDAIKAHSSWKMKLARYLENPDGSLKAQEIEPDNRCELGKWIHGSVSELGHHAEYQTLKSEHAKFHLAAAGVVKRAHQGTPVTEEIAVGAGSDFGVASQKVVGAILGMKRRISSKPPAAR